MGEKIFADAIRMERAKHFIGERMIINRPIPGTEKGRTVGGVVVGLYPHFILLNCGFYKTSITYKDLLLGAMNY